MATCANRAAAASVQPTAHRGRLDANAWQDIRRAACLAREQGVSLTVHGVLINPVQQMPHQEESRTKGNADQVGMESGPPPPQDLRVAQAAPNKPTRRQQRSAARLVEYNKKQKHATQVFAAWKSALRALARCFRAYRRNQIWTEWMRAEVERAPMLVGGRHKRPLEEPSVQTPATEEPDLSYLLGLPPGTVEAAWCSTAEEWHCFLPPSKQA